MDTISIGDAVVYFNCSKKTGLRWPHRSCLAVSKGQGVVARFDGDSLLIRTPAGGTVRKKIRNVILLARDSPTSLIEWVAGL